jgi:hypothetical protein
VLAGATHGRPRLVVGGHGMHKANLLRKTSGFRGGITGPRQRGSTTVPNQVWRNGARAQEDLATDRGEMRTAIERPLPTA